MEKIKQFLGSEQGKNILIVLVIILVGSGSFELGRLSNRTNSTSGIKIEYQNPQIVGQEANIVSTSIPKPINKPKTTKTTTTYYFASSRGNKYYSPECSGGKTIKQENKIYFATRAEAEGAGYELSVTCK